MDLILFMFAGRRANMEVQMPYLDRILRDYPSAQLHLWDLTRDPADQMYLKTLHGAHSGRVHVVGMFHPGHPISCMYPNGYPTSTDGKQHRPRGWRACRCIKHKPPYEQPYRYYAKAEWVKDDTVFVKVDDDLMFLETDRFSDLIEPVMAHPNRVVSASVYNNAVCAKYQIDWQMTRDKFGLGDPTLPKHDRQWWALHEDPEFAAWSHSRFLGNYHRARVAEPKYVRTRPGEAVSINCIAFGVPVLRKVAGMMSDRLGDEGAFDRMLPWIALTFSAAHLTFGPQDQRMHADTLDSIRDSYVALRKDYLR